MCWGWSEKLEEEEEEEEGRGGVSNNSFCTQNCLYGVIRQKSPSQESDGV